MPTLPKEATDESGLGWREDWDFSCFQDWPEEGEGGLRHAWAWELDRELGSDNPPFIVQWGLRQLEKHNELAKAHLEGRIQLSKSELEKRLAALMLPELKHPLELEVERLQSEIEDAELNSDGSELDAKKKAKLLAALGKAKKADLERIRDALRKAQLDLRAHRGQRGGKLLTEEEYEALFPSPKPAPPPSQKPSLKTYPLLETLNRFFQFHAGYVQRQPGELPLEELPFRDAMQQVGKSAGAFIYGQGHYTTIHAVEIDWQLSEKQLMERFRDWLREGKNPYRTSHNSPHKKGQGNNYPAWFTALAIYRLSTGAGRTRSEIAGLLSQLSGDYTVKRISAPNFSRAKRETKVRITSRERDLKSVVFNLPVLGPDWRDGFARM